LAPFTPPSIEGHQKIWTSCFAACLEICELSWSVKILIIAFDFLEKPMVLRKRTTQAKEKNFRI
jgi:hypothetical protein